MCSTTIPAPRKRPSLTTRACPSRPSTPSCALRDEGYVTLSPASGDRREKNASLTPAGQTYARALLEPLYALEDTVFARMGDARVQEMMDAIALFNMIFEKETETIK